MDKHEDAANTLYNFMYDEWTGRSMSNEESNAITDALFALAKIIDSPPSRADWISLAAKLRIVLDVDYPIDPA